MRSARFFCAVQNLKNAEIFSVFYFCICFKRNSVLYRYSAIRNGTLRLFAFFKKRIQQFFQYAAICVKRFIKFILAAFL